MDPAFSFKALSLSSVLLEPDYSKCLICKKINLDDPLNNLTKRGLSNFIAALHRLKDSVSTGCFCKLRMKMHSYRKKTSFIEHAEAHTHTAMTVGRLIKAKMMKMLPRQLPEKENISISKMFVSFVKNNETRKKIINLY